MRVPAGKRTAPDAAAQHLSARDAYGSVTVLALLLFLWGAISLFTIHVPAFTLPNALQVVVGGPAVLYFIATRHQPSTRVAVWFSCVAIVYALILLPWTAVVWCEAGRPLEINTVPELGMVIMGLVVPRFVWLGAMALGAFAAESLFAWLYARRVVPPGLLPITEPGATLCFALLGSALLMLRERRRQLALRHVRLQSEAAALREIGPLFATVRDDLETELVQLAGERTRLGVEGSSPRIDRAVARLGEVSRKLDNLIAGQPLPAEMDEAERSGGPRPVVSEEERLLLARATYSSAITTASVSALMGLVWVGTQGSYLPELGLLLAAGTAGVSLSVLIYLLRTRRQPSERVARWLMLALMGLLVTVGSINQVYYLPLGRPYTPFLMHKMVMVLLGLLAMRRSWPAVVLIVLTAGVALTLYFALRLGTHRNIISLAEPWVTLVFMGVGIAAAAMREQRVLASLRLLRSEAALVALHRRALMFLALRDQLNSPLQTLLLWADGLERGKSPGDLQRVHAGIERLIGRSQELAELDQLIPVGARRGSLDAERALRAAPRN